MDVPRTADPEQVSVRRLDDHGTQIAVFEFQDRLRDRVISSLRDSYLATGAYAPGAKALSEQSALSLTVAGGAAGGTAVSAAFSSTLYMATADPATLMTLGSGVGSAVMGAHGVVAQAPFLAVPGSLPVVAPLMAAQALTTAVVLHEFQRVEQRLDAVKRTLDTVLARAEATHVGELVTASRVVDEVYRRYELEGSFSDDMLIRLALAERDVRTLAERFRQLVEGRPVSGLTEIGQVDQANYDVHAAMLASFVGLRIANLRVCVDMERHPQSVRLSSEELTTGLHEAVDLWSRLLERSKSFEEARASVEKELEELNPAARRLPKGTDLQERRGFLNEAYARTLKAEKDVQKGFDTLIQSAETTLEELRNPKPAEGESPTLVFWEDETGRHSFYTDSDLLRLT